MKERRNVRDSTVLFEARLANLEAKVRGLRLTVRGYGMRIKTLEERAADVDS